MAIRNALWKFAEYILASRALTSLASAKVTLGVAG